MKIVNTKAGKAYHLTPGTQLEIERPNLFFNEWGEQSLPTDLPDTDLNRQLTNYPDCMANKNKPSANIDCSIQDGDYFMPCRQAILSAKRYEKISTSFYMNEGSFLARISDVALTDIFGDEVIPGITTVQQGIDFCWSLRDNSHPDYAIFPITVNLDGDRRYVNRVNYMNAEGTCIANNAGQGSYRFYNSFERKETVNNRIIKLEPGYYISPFIRAAYLLRRIFTYFGYTLLDHSLITSEPFSKMVFINNTIDSLVNGTIRLSHLVPDCMANTILDVYRKKFCCEFIPDEVARTVRIELFNDIIDSKPTIDLTPYLTSQPEQSFPDYQQLKLSSETVITEGSTYDATYELEAKYPEAWYKESDGSYCRTGYADSTIEERLSDGNIPYYAGGTLKAYEVKVPDCAFCMSYFAFSDIPNAKRGTMKVGETAPYIGDGRTLNSTIDGVPVESAAEDAAASDEDVVANNPDQKPILALVHYSSDYAIGTNHDVSGKWGYSLLYNGPSGIFEKFYRKFDNLLRNSMHKVSADLLLPNSLKNSLQVHHKVSLQGVELLFNIFKYTIGGKSEPVTSELMTTALYEPLSIAKAESERMVRNTEYKWMIVSSTTEVSEAEYIAAGYTLSESEGYIRNTIPAIYPLPPTKAIYDAGGTYYHRSYYIYYTSRTGGKVYYRIGLSLRPALFSEKDPNERPSRPTATPT